MRALASFIVLRRVQALHRVFREQPKASHVSCIALCVPPGVSSSRCFTLRCWSPVPRVPSRCVVPPGVVSNCFGNVDSSRGARRLTGVASAIVLYRSDCLDSKGGLEGEILAQVPTRNSYLTFQYLTLQLGISTSFRVFQGTRIDLDDLLKKVARDFCSKECKIFFGQGPGVLKEQNAPRAGIPN